jgi:uncharacterized membrane protein
MKKQTTAQRIARFMGEDVMNPVFVFLAIEHYTRELEKIDVSQTDFGIIKAQLMIDIAEDWKRSAVAE